MRVEPLFDNILVKVDMMEETTSGGLIIPESARQEYDDEQERGTVVACGPGRPADDDGLRRPFIPMVVGPGDRICFSKYGGSEVKINGENFLLMSEQVVLGIIREE